jgi:hypothetical protein
LRNLICGNLLSTPKNCFHLLQRHARVNSSK